MFHQTIFYPGRSAAVNMTGLTTAATASPSKYDPEKASPFTDLRKEYFRESPNRHQHRFGLGFPTIVPGKRKLPTSIRIGDHRNTLFVTSTRIKGATALATRRFGIFPLNRLGLPPISPMFASPEHYSNDIDIDINTFKDEAFYDPYIPNNDGKATASSKIKRVSDTDTATTASVATSISSPTPSLPSRFSSLDDEQEAERFEFVLDNSESLPDFITNSDNRGLKEDENYHTKDIYDTRAMESDIQRLARVSIFRKQDPDDQKYEYEVFGDTNVDEEDICSCCTPVLTNTSRPQQEFRQQEQQKQPFASQEERSIMTTTTTETKTTTTTTTQITTASSSNKSELIPSTSIPHSIVDIDMVLLPDLISETGDGHRSDVPLMGILKEADKSKSNSKCSIVAVEPHHNWKPSPAISCATSTAITEEPPFDCCKSCDSKQRQIDRQRKEMRHMKGMMKKMCLLLADTARVNGDDSNLLASNPAPPNPHTMINRVMILNGGYPSWL